MKNIIFLYFFILVNTCFSFFCKKNIAQSTTLTHTHYGIQAGINVGSVLPKGKIDKNSTGKVIVGLNAGVYTQYLLTSKIGIHAALNYSYKGADFFQPTYSDTMQFDIPQLNLYNFPAPYTSLNIKGYMKQHYLELPIHFQFFITKKMALMAGIQASYLLHGVSKSTQNIYVGTDINYPFLTYLDTLIDVSTQFKKIDWAVSAGSQWQLYKPLTLTLRGSYSLSSVYKKELRQLKKDFANLFATITVGYALPYKK